ncbi:MAG TPA: hypothetical protein VIS74_01045, partial [Chthoniobacterales bacterium]
MLFWTVTAVIFAEWAVLYLPALRTMPGWYGDETLTLDIAENLIHGRFAAAALFNTFATYIYQPIYLFFLGLGWQLSGGDIVGARFFNTVLALMIGLTLWVAGRRVVGNVAAATAAIAFLGYEQTVIHFRQCFAHNGVAFGLTLSILLVCRKPSLGIDLKSGLGLLFAVGSHPLGVYPAMVSGFTRLFSPRSWLPLIAPSALVLGLFYFCVYLRFGSWLISDIAIVGIEHEKIQAANQHHFWENLYRFYAQDSFHIIGLTGVLALLISCRWKQRIPLAGIFLLLSLTLFSNRSNLTVFYYQAVVLLPLLSLGIGWMLVKIGALLARLIGKHFGTQSARIAKYLVPILAVTSFGISSAILVFSGKLLPRNQPWVTQSPHEVEEAAAWVNERTSSEDVILANSNIGWLLKGRKANLLQYTAWTGLPTFMHEHPVPH